jgi:hypothetical protein
MNGERPLEGAAQRRPAILAEGADGSELLDALATFLRRYVAMSASQAAAVALWVVHTYALDACEQSPLLAITSAERRSGKTRLLDVLEVLVANPWRVVTPSEAVVFRKLHADRPTLLLDEVDAIFNPKAGANAEGLRALLNAGNRPGTMVPRCVGPSQTLVSFKVFGAKALAGIKDLPDTIADRAIPIRLQRRAPTESVERFRRRGADEAGEPLSTWTRSWVAHHAPHLEQARPHLPDELHDRAQDAWEPLLAIADRAGGDWPEQARQAAIALSADDQLEEASAGIRLLADVKTIFDAEAVDRIFSATLANELHKLEESPWGEWFGRPITQRGIAKLLGDYGIRSRTIRVEDETAKGYLREQFEEVWPRYLPAENVTTSQRASLGEKQPFFDRHEPDLVTDEKRPDSAWIDPCDVVTDEITHNGNRDELDADELLDYYREKLAAEEL